MNMFSGIVLVIALIGCILASMGLYKVLMCMKKVAFNRIENKSGLITQERINDLLVVNNHGYSIDKVVENLKEVNEVFDYDMSGLLIK